MIAIAILIVILSLSVLELLVDVGTDSVAVKMMIKLIRLAS